MDILSKDVMAFYDFYALGVATGLNEPRIQYKDYSAWQLKQLDDDNYDVHDQFWLNQLSGELPVYQFTFK